MYGKISNHGIRSTGLIFLVFGFVFFILICLFPKNSFARKVVSLNGVAVVILPEGDVVAQGNLNDNPNCSAVFLKTFYPRNLTKSSVTFRFTLEGLVEYNRYEMDSLVNRRMIRAKRGFAKFLRDHNWCRYTGYQGDAIDIGRIVIKQDFVNTGMNIEGTKMFVRIADYQERKAMIKYRNGSLGEYFQKVLDRAEKDMKAMYKIIE